MKLAIMQPYFMPYLGYWQLINAVDRFIILDDVNFIKKGWIHRNNILTNRQPKQINVTINKASQNKNINDLYLVNEDNWKYKIVNQIKNSYSKSPFLKERLDLIEEIIFSKEENLSLFLYYGLKKINDLFENKTEIISTSSYYKKNGLKGQDRIIDICKKEQINTYINPIGGQELYSRETFKDNGIELKFIKMEEIYYSQFNNEFIPNLSIIDVLMFNSLEEINTLLNKYKLV